MNQNIRFFITCYGEADSPPDTVIDVVEVDEMEFLQHDGVISYERHTIFENGCNQVCLVRESEDLPYFGELRGLK
jgi:hypothetical protein